MIVKSRSGTFSKIYLSSSLLLIFVLKQKQLFFQIYSNRNTVALIGSPWVKGKKKKWVWVMCEDQFCPASLFRCGLQQDWLTENVSGS